MVRDSTRSHSSDQDRDIEFAVDQHVLEEAVLVLGHRDLDLQERGAKAIEQLREVVARDQAGDADREKAAKRIFVPR